eukprot:COSAG02_NODE_4455_length_5341_cov_2.211560_1_plen_494_part_00
MEQVVVEPPMWPTSPIRATQLHWLSALGAEASPVFWQSWWLYPHTAVAELQPGQWNFSQITPLLQDMLNATRGRELVLQFGTVPTWMESGPTGDRRWDFGNASYWNDTQVWMYKGHNITAFRNLTAVAEYYANFMSFYTAGGFTDSKTGKHYDSGFHYDIPYFMFGNEMEYKQTPEVFTQQSDAVNTAVAAVSPNTKFIGLGLAGVNKSYEGSNYSYFKYFLNQTNHAASAPVSEAIDYHYYASPSNRTNVSCYTAIFAQADGFIERVRAVEAVRRRLSPSTKTYLKELGVIAPGDPFSMTPLPDLFWSASAAYWVYLYSQLALLKIDVASMSQLVGGLHDQGKDGLGHGANYASVTMLDWVTGKPNARYYALRMLVHAFGSRAKRLVQTNLDHGTHSSAVTGGVYAQAFEVTEHDGSKQKKLLLVNKDLEPSARVRLCSREADSCFRCMESIDGRNPWRAPVAVPLGTNATISMGPFAVAILTNSGCDALAR